MRYPYLTLIDPYDGQSDVSTGTSIDFTVKTDLGSSISTISFNVNLNGVACIIAGAFQAGFSGTLTPAVGELAVSIIPSTALLSDTTYEIEVEASDNLGYSTTLVTQFTTYQKLFSTALKRDELRIPVPERYSPITSVENATITEYSDEISSVTAGWSGYGVVEGDLIKINSGEEDGSVYVVSESSSTICNVFQTFKTSESNIDVEAIPKRNFTDNASIETVTSSRTSVTSQKKWGNIRSSYLVGYPSDANFPQDFSGEFSASVTDNVTNPSVSNGGLIFEDGVTGRLSFQFNCSVPVTSGRYDKLSIPLATRIQENLTDTATVVNGSSTLIFSGPDFRDELVVGSKISIQDDNESYTVSSISQVANEIEISPPVLRSSDSGLSVTRDFTGTRLFAALEGAFSDKSSLFVGASSGASPALFAENQAGAILRRDGNLLKLSSVLGETVSQEVVLSISPEFFNENTCMVEILFGDNKSLTARLYSTENPEENGNSVSVTGLVAPELQNFVLCQYNTNTDNPVGCLVAGDLLFADIEQGLGSVLGVLTDFEESQSKWRPYTNLQKIALTENSELASVFTRLSKRSRSFDIHRSSTYINTDVSGVVVTDFEIEGGVIVQVGIGTTSQRDVNKFSFNRGFSKISLSFVSDAAGPWYIVLDGTLPSNGTVLAQGVYEDVGVEKSVELSSLLFTGVADGLHTLKVVLAKQPDTTAVIGIAQMTGSAEVA